MSIRQEATHPWRPLLHMNMDLAITLQLIQAWPLSSYTHVSGQLNPAKSLVIQCHAICTHTRTDPLLHLFWPAMCMRVASIVRSAQWQLRHTANARSGRCVSVWQEGSTYRPAIPQQVLALDSIARLSDLVEGLQST